MNPIADYLPSTVSDMRQPNAPKTGAKLSPRLVDELWRRMAAIYGHKWTSSFGDADTDETWARGLAGLTQAEIAHGLKSCVLRSRDRLRYGDEDWPPTLGEFRTLCTYEKHKPVYHQVYAAIEHKPVDLTAEERHSIINDLCRSAGLPEKYPQREPGEDDE